MKHYIAILSCLSLTMCATLTPEQSAERRMNWNRVATGALTAGLTILSQGQQLPNDRGFRK